MAQTKKDKSDLIAIRDPNEQLMKWDDLRQFINHAPFSKFSINKQNDPLSKKYDGRFLGENAALRTLRNNQNAVKPIEMWAFANHIYKPYSKDLNASFFQLLRIKDEITGCYHEDFNDTRRFVLDIDSKTLAPKSNLIHLEDVLLRCRRIGLKPWIVVETSPARFHIVFDGDQGIFDEIVNRLVIVCRFFEIEFNNDIDHLIERLMIDFEVDPQTFRAKISSHSFRVPGSVNIKTKTYDGHETRQVYPVIGQQNRRFIYNSEDIDKIKAEVIKDSNLLSTVEIPDKKKPLPSYEIFDAAKNDLASFVVTGEFKIGTWGDFEMGCIAALIADHWKELIVNGEIPLAWKWFIAKLGKTKHQATALRRALKEQGFFELTSPKNQFIKKCEYVKLGEKFEATASLIRAKKAKYQEKEYLPGQSNIAIGADVARCFYDNFSRQETIEYVWQRYSDYIERYPHQKKLKYRDIEYKVNNFWIKLEKQNAKSLKKRSHSKKQKPNNTAHLITL